MNHKRAEYLDDLELQAKVLRITDRQIADADEGRTFDINNTLYKKYDAERLAAEKQKELKERVAMWREDKDASPSIPPPAPTTPDDLIGIRRSTTRSTRQGRDVADSSGLTNQALGSETSRLTPREVPSHARAIGSTQATPTMTDSSTSPVFSEEDGRRAEIGMMQEEDLRSDLVRHREALDGLIAHIRNMDRNFSRAEEAYNNLRRYNEELGLRNRALERDFEHGRQLYMKLEGELETRLQHQKDINEYEAKEMKDDLHRISTLFVELGQAYEMLESKSNSSYHYYEGVIAELEDALHKANQKLGRMDEEVKFHKERNIEFQEEMIRSAVSKKQAKSIGSRYNKPIEVRKLMVKDRIEEIHAITLSGIVSKNIKLIVKNGVLFKKEGRFAPVILEDIGDGSFDTNNTKGINYVWSIVYLKNRDYIDEGYNMSENNKYLAEYRAIYEGGMHLTKKEAEELKEHISQGHSQERLDLEGIHDTTDGRKSASFPDRGLPSQLDTSILRSEREKKHLRSASMNTDNSPPPPSEKKKNKNNRTELNAQANEPERSATFRTRRIGEGVSVRDMKYKPIGTKYIHVGRLREGKLSLRHPNGTQLGRVHKISPQLVDIFTELAYDGHINHNMYDRLDLEDKEIYNEVLKASKLDLSLKKWSDPVETLKSEFDKLRGELLLGNDNPHIRSRLKEVAIDMFSRDLISKSDLNKIISQI